MFRLQRHYLHAIRKFERFSDSSEGGRRRCQTRPLSSRP